MARFLTKVHSPWPAEKAFAYMADLRNFAAWDPGVRRSLLVEGAAPGPGAAFDVTVAGVGKDLTLRYRTVVHEAPSELLVEARSTLFTSIDRITVTEAATPADGCAVTYDAELRLNGPLGLADIVLRPFFRRIGDRAAAGLRRALEGSGAS